VSFKLDTSLVMYVVILMLIIKSSAQEYANGDKCIVFIQTKRDAADFLDQLNPADPAQTDGDNLFIQVRKIE
jgi:hypothetical protein